jgi:hypothetical protein
MRFLQAISPLRLRKDLTQGTIARPILLRLALLHLWLC